MNNTKSAAICLWATLTIFMAFGTFAMKNRVQDLEKELLRINSSIKEDIKAIHILKAEWSHLNNPERLRSLAQKHIGLNPVKAEQIIDYAALPFEYESSDMDRKILARQNINSRAARNRELRQLAKAQN
jgi:cell division protein FtsL